MTGAFKNRWLLIATTNPGKVREFRTLLAGTGYTIVTPGDLGLILDVEEHGVSYAENAALKAHAYAKASGVPSLADDSGLEVDALGGKPGIHSARYGGPGLNDSDRVDLLLQNLSAVSDDKRSARFRAAVVVATTDGRQIVGEGSVEGTIIHERRGKNGFGYDPVFLLPERGVTTAQLEPAEKDEISHRARALRAVLPVLDDFLAGS